VAYRIENIGSAFDNKGIEALTQRLNQNESAGWKFHSVFMIQHKTCLGLSSANTYLAVFQHSPSGA
jgi:hypothetical protein